jgi:hypothetical protein
MKVFASFVLVLSMAACGDDEPGGGSCPGSPSGGCELVVGSAEECPSYDAVCTGVCNASYDCCYCDERGFWSTLYIECADCAGDAGPDAP